MTYRVTIKKEYAAAILEDLVKLDAVEVRWEDTEADAIPDWQQDAVLKRLDAMQDPANRVDWVATQAFLKRLSA